MYVSREGVLEKKSRTFGAIALVLALAGLALMAYPSVANLINGTMMSKVNAEYSSAVSNLSDTKAKQMLAQARLYNEQLANGSASLSDEPEGYSEQLALSEDQVMGRLSIPSIELDIPIYHGTSDSVLMLGAGHLSGSSLPVGGTGTHCVLMGHTGMPESKLFGDLTKLKQGDAFYLHVLNEVIAYEVDSIDVVLPEELKALGILPEEDRCSLVTCTPYGVNSHRLVVKGLRCSDKSSEESLMRPSSSLVISAVALGGSLVVLGAFFAGRALRRKRKEERMREKIMRRLNDD